jgi:hypothetical protein
VVVHRFVIVVAFGVVLTIVNVLNSLIPWDGPLMHFHDTNKNTN